MHVCHICITGVTHSVTDGHAILEAVGRRRCQTKIKIQFHTAENFPEQLNFSHLAISQVETFLASISKHDKVPKHTLKLRSTQLHLAIF